MKLIAFRRFRKIVKSNYLLRHVCPSGRMENPGFHWKDFHEILHLRIFRKSVEKTELVLKSDMNNLIYTKARVHL